MASTYQPVTVSVGSGGRFMPDRPLASVGVGNYSVKKNWRRQGINETAEEVSREGWDYFKPNASGSATNQKTVLSGFKLHQIGEARRPNGTAVPVGIANNRLYWFDYDNSQWTQISGYYSLPMSWERWQIINVGAYTVFNCGVDLPFTWQVGASSAFPIYELREEGIASVGMIWEYNQVLMCGDIVEVASSSKSGLLNGITPFAAISLPNTSQTLTNLVTRSQQFDDAVWTKTNVTITANSANGPDGTATADTIQGSGATPLEHFIRQTATIVAGSVCTFSIYVKPTLASGKGRLVFGDSSFNTAAVQAEFDTNGAAGVGTISVSSLVGTPTSLAATIEATGLNGYYRVSVTGKLDAVTTAALVHFELADSTGSYTYTGASDAADLIWGAQLVQQTGAGPYIATTGATASLSVQRIQNRILWSNLGDPRDFAATVNGNAGSGSPTVTLDWPMPSLAIGDEITVIGAGPAGGNLVTTISNIVGTTLTMATNASTTIAGTPVQKTGALNSIVGSYDLDDDGTPIIRGLAIQNRVAVYKSSAIFVGYYTGDVDEPFVFERQYRGKRTPRYRWTLVDVAGQYHLFAGDEHFYRFRLGTQEPEIDEVLDDCCTSAFYSVVSGVSEGDVWAADNACSNEIFFWPGTASDVLAYDYAYGCASTIDGSTQFGCAASVHKPAQGKTVDERELWFIMGDTSGLVTQYGKTNLAVSTSQRYGVSFTKTWTTGISDFGDPFDEKDVRTWVALNSATTAASLTVTISGCDRDNQSISTLETKAIETGGSTPTIIPLYYRKSYFQETLATSSSGPIRMRGRIWEVGKVRSRAITRIAS